MKRSNYPIKSPIPGRIKFLHSWFEHDYVDFSERRLKHDRTKRCSLRRTSAYFCDRFRNCSHEFLGLAPRISIGRWARTTGIPMPPRRHFCTPVTFAFRGIVDGPPSNVTPFFVRRFSRVFERRWSNGWLIQV